MTLKALEVARREGIRHVILTGYYRANLHQGPVGCLTDDGRAKTPREAEAVFARQLEATVRACTRAGLTVWILEDVPDYDQSVPHQLAQANFYEISPNTGGYGLEEYRRRNAFVDQTLRAVTGPKVHLVDVSRVICPGGRCLVQFRGALLYYDGHHLNIRGVTLFRDALRPVMEGIAGQRLRAEAGAAVSTGN